MEERARLIQQTTDSIMEVLNRTLIPLVQVDLGENFSQETLEHMTKEEFQFYTKHFSRELVAEVIGKTVYSVANYKAGTNTIAPDVAEKVTELYARVSPMRDKNEEAQELSFWDRIRIQEYLLTSITKILDRTLPGLEEPKQEQEEEVPPMTASELKELTSDFSLKLVAATVKRTVNTIRDYKRNKLPVPLDVARKVRELHAAVERMK